MYLHAYNTAEAMTPSLPPHAAVRDITSRPSGWVRPEAPGFVDPSDATKHPDIVTGSKMRNLLDQTDNNISGRLAV